MAVDIEATGLNLGNDRIRLVQFGDGEAGWALPYPDWKGLIKETLHTYDRPMVAHNALYDTRFLKRDGITIPQRLMHDTMIMTWLMNPAAKMGLKPAATRYVDKRSAAGQGFLAQTMANGGWDWSTVPVEAPAYWKYAVLDTCLSALLAQELMPKINLNGWREAYELELAVIHCLRDAEIAGLMTDPDYLRRAAAQLEAELAWLRPQIPIKNPGADKQVIAYLQGLGAHLFVLTENGNLSVDKEVLKYLTPQFPVADLILQYRQKTRLLGSYIEKMMEYGTHDSSLAVGGVLHCNTKPVAARTGRMSITDPPLQTLPRGRVVRDAIVARPGNVFVMADFAGMEMRALASDAREPNMLAAFNRGEDLHNFVATALYGPDFTKPQRSICKNAGFGKVYGAGVEKFAVTAEISVGEAKEFLARYAEMFPGVDAHLARVAGIVKERARESGGYGYVDLIDKRRLPVEGSKAYKGVNFRIQGSCAVVMKRKMVELDSAGLGPFFRLSVHDELIYEVPIDIAADARKVLDKVMPDRHSFPGVVLETESDVSARWGSHYRDDFPAYVATEDDSWAHGIGGEA